MQHACKIPEDLEFEILTRLPSKSLLRFKCVSKKWSSLISSRYFGNKILKTTRKQPPRLYMCILKKEENTNQSALLSASLDSNCFLIDQDLTVPGIVGGFILNAVRGLMCFSINKKKVAVYNPTTRQLLILPDIQFDIIAEQGQMNSTRYYIGHDPINDQYKVLCTAITRSSDFSQIIKSEHWVFLLEAQGSSWKKVVPLGDYHPHIPFGLQRSINGPVVHYMASLDNFRYAVVSFDIRSEELTVIPIPILQVGVLKAGLVEYGGKIAFFDHTSLKDEGLVNLWVLEDVGKKEWSKKTQVLQPCQKHLVHDPELLVYGTTQDGKVLLSPWKAHSSFYILFYDMKLNDLRKVEIKGVPDSFFFAKECLVDFKFMDESESIIYLKT